jgi:hypothetical protein
MTRKTQRRLKPFGQTAQGYWSKPEPSLPFACLVPPDADIDGQAEMVDQAWRRPMVVALTLKLLPISACEKTDMPQLHRHPSIRRSGS